MFINKFKEHTIATPKVLSCTSVVSAPKTSGPTIPDSVSVPTGLLPPLSDEWASLHSLLNMVFFLEQGAFALPHAVG